MDGELRPMKVVIPGGTGQVGTILARAFQERGHEVIALSRRPGVCHGARWRGMPGRWANGLPKSTGRTSSSTWPAGA